MKRDRQPSVLDLCVAALGVHRGALTASYVARYAMTQRRLGKFPTAVEFADDWKITERSAWRQRASIHAALGDDWPDVVALVAREIERRQLRELDALRITVPAKLATA